jgi:hypothetical protein
MPTLYLPEKVTLVHTIQSLKDGKLVTEPMERTSSTDPISAPFSGPLKDSFSPEALENKKTLTLFPGQKKEFTDAEASYLLGLYPFIKEVPVEAVEAEEEVAPVEAPALGEAPNLVTSLELPTNFMQLKKFAVSKGCDILPTDKKDDILAKLAQIQ